MTSSPLELAANALITVSIALAGRNSVHTWWLGIMGCALFAALFAQARLYADALLQVFFILTSAWGWWRWQQRHDGSVLPVSRVHPGTLAWIAPTAAVLTLGYGLLLHRFTNAYAPFVDSAVLVLSVIAQLLLMQRRLDTWPFWLLTNTIAVPLYASRDLYLTAVLYAFYWVNALVAWRHWRRLMTRA
ncbi:MAG: nicotinamide riboside transporter PnuC [Pseudomonadales bacterium]|jgi:nicotinamide mononucleotide transporter|nr:nicotinamide riboside transporter PnuC [Pseudomonadales bacterium]